MRFRLSTKFHDRPVVEEEKAPQDAENTVTDDKETAQVRDTDSSSIRDDSNVDFQRGDEAIRAMTQIWSKRELIFAYILYVLNIFQFWTIEGQG